MFGEGQVFTVLQKRKWLCMVSFWLSSTAVQAITITLPGGETYSFPSVKKTSEFSTYAFRHMTAKAMGADQLLLDLKKEDSGFQQLKSGVVLNDATGVLDIAIVVNGRQSVAQSTELGIRYCSSQDTAVAGTLLQSRAQVSASGPLSAMGYGWVAAHVMPTENEARQLYQDGVEQGVIHAPGRHVLWVNIPDISLQDVFLRAPRITLDGREYELSGDSGKQPDVPITVLFHFRGSDGIDLLTVHYSGGAPATSGAVDGYLLTESDIGALGYLLTIDVAQQVARACQVPEHVVQGIVEAQAGHREEACIRLLTEVRGRVADLKSSLLADRLEAAQQKLLAQRVRDRNFSITAEDMDLQREMTAIGRHLDPFAEILMLQMGFRPADVDAIKGKPQAGYELLYTAYKKGLLKNLYPAARSTVTGLYSLPEQITSGSFPLLQKIISDAMDGLGDQETESLTFKLKPVDEARWRDIDPVLANLLRLQNSPARMWSMLNKAGFSNKEMIEMQSHWQRKADSSAPVERFSSEQLSGCIHSLPPEMGGSGQLTYRAWVNYLQSTDNLKLVSLAYYIVDQLASGKVEPLSDSDLVDIAGCIVHRGGDKVLALRLLAARKKVGYGVQIGFNLAHGYMNNPDSGLGIRCEDSTNCYATIRAKTMPSYNKDYRSACEVRGYPTLEQKMQSMNLTKYSFSPSK